MAPDPDRLTDAEQQALLAVWRLEEEAYGASVRDELSHRTGRRLSISAIYVILVRLEKRGYLTSRRSDPLPVQGGKARRCFRIESKGIAALEQSRLELERLWEGLPTTPQWRQG